MNNLKTLGASVALTLMLAAVVVAGEIPTGPCAPNPGEMNSPPCASQQASNDLTALGETNTPPATESLDFISLAKTALALIF